MVKMEYRTMRTEKVAYPCACNTSMTWHLRSEWIYSQCTTHCPWRRVKSSCNTCICSDFAFRDLFKKCVDSFLERSNFRRHVEGCSEQMQIECCSMMQIDVRNDGLRAMYLTAHLSRPHTFLYVNHRKKNESITKSTRSNVMQWHSNWSNYSMVGEHLLGKFLVLLSIWRITDNLTNAQRH